jgi:GntR family transcriptional regulator
MAVITLDNASASPKYQQIVDQIKAHVVAGTLPPGTPLPSVRQLATDLGINVNTVLAAYHALDGEGIVLMRHGARAVIHPHLGRRAEPAPQVVAEVRGALERARADALLLGMTAESLRELARQVFEL